tara:strand:+ start:248 stop:508 length:261 start_codon:yes stop_codon:yes gene_type:complete
MEIKPLDSNTWTKAEGENYKEILVKPVPVKEDNKFIGCSEVAELLDVTVDRVRYLSRLERIPSFTLRDRGTRIYEKDKIMELVGQI